MNNFIIGVTLLTSAALTIAAQNPDNQHARFRYVEVDKIENRLVADIVSSTLSSLKAQGIDLNNHYLEATYAKPPKSKPGIESLVLKVSSGAPSESLYFMACGSDTIYIADRSDIWRVKSPMRSIRKGFDVMKSDSIPGRQQVIKWTYFIDNIHGRLWLQEFWKAPNNFAPSLDFNWYLPSLRVEGYYMLKDIIYGIHFEKAIDITPCFTLTDDTLHRRETQDTHLKYNFHSAIESPFRKINQINYGGRSKFLCFR